MSRRKKPFKGHYTVAQKNMITIVIVLIVLCLILLAALGIRAITKKDPEPTETASPVQSSAPVSTTAVETEPTDPWEQTETVLKLTPDAGQEYIDETLFLGDSNTVRYLWYTNDQGVTYTSKQNTIAVVGMGAGAISSLACMQFSTGTYTMVQSVSILQPKRIIMMFGTNNLDGNITPASYFIGTYQQQIQNVQNAYPYADIIICSIIPVSQYCTYPNASIYQIRSYNEAIIAMCEENDWKYLNLFEALEDTNTGYAVYEYMDSTDGLHMSALGVKAAIEYIRTHAYLTEDRRPELNEIPYVYGPMTDLITQQQAAQQAAEEAARQEAEESQAAETTPAETQAVETVPVEEPAEEVPAESAEVVEQPVEEVPAENTEENTEG